MEITSYITEIGSHTHQLAMRDLKPLSGLAFDQHSAFWTAWHAISPLRRDEIAHAMLSLGEDNVDLDFSTAFFWLLDDDDAGIRSTAIEGLWENDSPRLMRRLLKLLEEDPTTEVRENAVLALSRFAYQVALGELADEDAALLQQTLTRVLFNRQQPLEVRRRALESAGYFSDLDDVQHEIELAYASDEQLLRESALVAMGRSMQPRWLPTIAAALTAASPALRYEAARAAGEMAEEARTLVVRLTTLTEDDDSEIVLAAIWALGQIGGKAAINTLKRLSKSRDDVRSQAAAEALEELTFGDDSLFGGV